ncbi:MAG: helix-turn-helix transcriptional regulator [Bacteroidales bacterium]
MIIKSIAENIRLFRELENITRKEMAARLNISVSGYSKIERGEVDITISRIHQIAKILNVSMNQLINFEWSMFFSYCSRESCLSTETIREELLRNKEFRQKIEKILQDDIQNNQPFS